jgi:hypothetical protein
MGFVVQRANHQWTVGSFGGLPRSYFHAVQELAKKQGWRIEQQGSKFYLRFIEPETFRPAKALAHATPSNHLAFFNSLGELHEFLTNVNVPKDQWR